MYILLFCHVSFIKGSSNLFFSWNLPLFSPSFFCQKKNHFMVIMKFASWFYLHEICLQHCSFCFKNLGLYFEYSIILITGFTIVRMGRDIAYDSWSCDLLCAASSPDLYRINLEQVNYKVFVMNLNTLLLYFFLSRWFEMSKKINALSCVRVTYI